MDTNRSIAPPRKGGQEERTAIYYYLTGNQCRREGNWQKAIDNYIIAIEMDPESPAVYAKQMLDSILGFYNKDMYNP